MNDARILTRSPSEDEAAQSAASPKRKPSKPPRGGTVVVVEGRECMSIPLTRGQFAIVDMEDAPKILTHCWMAFWHRNTFYARRIIRINKSGRRGFISMHHLIIDCPAGLQRDHVNRNGLDNRRCNLRVATSAMQRLNTRKTRVATSRFRGVSKNGGRGKPWRASITTNGKARQIGLFEDEREAATAYDAAAFLAWGELATLNFSQQ